MTIGAITTGVQSVSATGAVTPTAGLNVATAPASTADFTLFLEIQSLTAAQSARIQLEESANGFTTAIPLMVVDVKGAIASSADKVYSKRKYEIPSTIFGTSSAVVRANVTALSGGTLGVRSWVEY